MSAFSNLLNTYKRGAGGALSTSKKEDAPKERPAYKHPLHDRLASLKGTRGKDREDTTTGDGLTIMMIIIDNLPHEAIWRTWLERASVESRKKVRLLIHAKNPHLVVSEWVHRHLCKTVQLSPSWGSLELTEVMVRLLEESFDLEQTLELPGMFGKDPNSFEKSDRGSAYFLFVSESCIPIRSLDETIARLDSEKASWLNFTDKATNGYAQQQQFDKLRGVIPVGSLYKADQWVLLAREHALAIRALPEALNDEHEGAPREGSPYRNKYLDMFKKTRASDEMYFPCAMGILGLIDGRVSSDQDDGHIAGASEAPESNEGKEMKKDIEKEAEKGGTLQGKDGPALLRRQVTYVNWAGGGKNPKALTACAPLLTGADYTAAMDQDSLFMRKVVYDPPLPAYSQGSLYHERWRPSSEQRAFLQAWTASVTPAPEAPDKACDHEPKVEEEEAAAKERKISREPPLPSLEEHEAASIYHRMIDEADRFFSVFSSARRSRQEKGRWKDHKRHRDSKGGEDSYRRSKARR